jgi:hypothetical protein
MELDLQSLVGLNVHAHPCTHWLRPSNSPPPPHLGSYTRTLLVSQDRRHLFVTSWKEIRDVFKEYLELKGSKDYLKRN